MRTLRLLSPSKNFRFAEINVRRELACSGVVFIASYRLLNMRLVDSSVACVGIRWSRPQSHLERESR